ncbi:hypothetical protein GGQ92_001821 [Gracilibacillus halotolerans]|uniref:Uncharacterized protein n=1 Tax=Gracilibacillus halotolerans TaxID=74386 RepID=A0A841RK02_9BACI|nr:hypothetical protein [Gracilibacillus halotolerans]MBB6513031.1 hypothetical protein [Gracilibacillus halotolerans]
MRLFFQIIAGLIGAAAILFSITFLLGAVTALITKSSTPTSIAGLIIGAIILIITPAVIGFILLKWAFTAHKIERRKLNKKERMVLQLAEDRGGRLTLTELAMETPLTLEEAKDLLDEWAIKGYATIKISEKGTLVYHFYDSLTIKEKQDAKGVSSFEQG